MLWWLGQRFFDGENRVGKCLRERSALSPVAMIVFTNGNGANGRSLTTAG
ncbi:MAG: hypothetical protein R3C26_06985 [Calditrichia bacterium]